MSIFDARVEGYEVKNSTWKKSIKRGVGSRILIFLFLLLHLLHFFLLPNPEVLLSLVSHVPLPLYWPSGLPSYMIFPAIGSRALLGELTTSVTFFHYSTLPWTSTPRHQIFIIVIRNANITYSICLSV